MDSPSFDHDRMRMTRRYRDVLIHHGKDPRQHISRETLESLEKEESIEALDILAAQMEEVDEEEMLVSTLPPLPKRTGSVARQPLASLGSNSDEVTEETREHAAVSKEGMQRVDGSIAVHVREDVLLKPDSSSRSITTAPRSPTNRAFAILQEELDIYEAVCEDEMLLSPAPSVTSSRTTANTSHGIPSFDTSDTVIPEFNMSKDEVIALIMGAKGRSCVTAVVASSETERGALTTTDNSQLLQWIENVRAKVAAAMDEPTAEKSQATSVLEDIEDAQSL
mmetsp:Transcript_37420/g.82049  ORF Transcript_37420/g.82049 Transcript_37420/m.82049 type:complete len:280 (+) Transcript_37420:609-1448(+)